LSSGGSAVSQAACSYVAKILDNEIFGKNIPLHSIQHSSGASIGINNMNTSID